MSTQITYPRTIAVLTGDIVGSTALGAEKLERAMSALEDCAEMQAEWMGESLHFTRHRGDGWQVALAEPKYALRSALMFRAALKASGKELDTYIGIGAGAINAPVGTNLNNESSRAFTLSGTALEAVKTSPLTSIQVARSPILNAVAIPLDALSRDWTTVQAEIMEYYLSPEGKKRPSYSELGKALNKSRQSISKSLDAAHFFTIINSLNNLEVSFHV